MKVSIVIGRSLEIERDFPPDQLAALLELLDAIDDSEVSPPPYRRYSDNVDSGLSKPFSPKIETEV